MAIFKMYVVGKVLIDETVVGEYTDKNITGFKGLYDALVKADYISKSLQDKGWTLSKYEDNSIGLYPSFTYELTR